MNPAHEALSRARMRLSRALHPVRTARYKASRWVRRMFTSVPGIEPRPLGELQLPGVSIVRHIVAAAGSRELPLPVSLDGDTHPFFRTRAVYPEFRRCLARMKGARIHGPDGFLYLPDGRVLVENHFFFRDHIENHDLYFERLPEPRRIEGSVFPLVGFCPAAHYHWMTEVLYRLHGCLDDLPSDLRFLVPSRASGVHREALRAFGIDAGRILEMSVEDHFVFDELWYASPISKSGYETPEAARWVRDRFAAYADARATSPTAARPEKVYITRRLAKRRRIVNEQELIDLLESAGFHCVECERLSFLQQAETFSRATVVVAPHGAGLVNLLFAPLGGSLLEIYPEEIPMGATCYWSLANALGWSYRYLRGSVSGLADDSSDISVSIPHVRRWLERSESKRGGVG
ncbi:glycosyltransferase family 61 protein [Congregicoccus parvus]|uniref:glycosyltransferase family 61 protein n=1 Tax=Congregicoccus parvus TaxID=3081749 RepID=UPI003FA53663